MVLVGVGGLGVIWCVFEYGVGLVGFGFWVCCGGVCVGVCVGCVFCGYLDLVCGVFWLVCFDGGLGCFW